MYRLICTRCRSDVVEETYHSLCPSCGGALGFDYSPWEVLFPGPPEAGQSMWRYRDLLPVCHKSKIVSLLEGGTPLLAARLYSDYGLHYKNEALNPTGSMKDRALSLAITKAVEFGFGTVILYSDGSTALSSSAYAARAGLKHITVVARGTPDSTLLPLVLHNSLIIEHQGSRSEALDWAHEASLALGIYESSTYRRANPYQSEGPKTIAYEVFGQLDGVPDWVVVPTGGGGTLAGIWRGFQELRALGRTEKLPRMAGVLPAGYTMIAEAMERGLTTDDELRKLAPACPPPTIQVKLAMTFPPDGLEAAAAVRDSGGMFFEATDEEALEAQRRLAGCEGLYAEPSAAVSLAGVQKLVNRGLVKHSQSIVAVITGSGFRETAQLASLVSVPRIAAHSGDRFSQLKDILQK